jgi:hypothetical protein
MALVSSMKRFQVPRSGSGTGGRGDGRPRTSSQSRATVSSGPADTVSRPRPQKMRSAPARLRGDRCRRSRTGCRRRTPVDEIGSRRSTKDVRLSGADHPLERAGVGSEKRTRPRHCREAHDAQADESWATNTHVIPLIAPANSPRNTPHKASPVSGPGRGRRLRRGTRDSTRWNPAPWKMTRTGAVASMSVRDSGRTGPKTGLTPRANLFAGFPPKKKPAVSSGSCEADEGTRTLDLLHGKQML